MRLGLVPIILSFFALSASADSVRELGWEDLVPESANFEDPFRLLSAVQISDLALIADYRKRESDGQRLSDVDRKQVSNAEKYLADKGIDVDDMLARRDEIIELRKQATSALETGLDGETVRLPGFVLPLEYDGVKVTEFLLVPFVGACIHVPPPPANQMVHVKFSEGYELPILFDSVWVEGRMQVGQADHELYLTDGAADVSVGYSIVADEVSSYSVQ